MFGGNQEMVLELQASPAVSTGHSGRPIPRPALLVGAVLPLLAGCTTVHIHQSERVEISTKFGLLQTINVEASRPLFIQEQALGFSLSSSSVLLGFRKTRSVHLLEGADKCHVLVLIDGEKDLQEAADLLRKASPTSVICQLGEERK